MFTWYRAHWYCRNIAVSAVCVRTCALFMLIKDILQLYTSIFPFQFTEGVQVKMAAYVNDAREVVSLQQTGLYKCLCLHVFCTDRGR